MELSVVDVDLLVLLDDLAEGEVQLLGLVEGEEGAHYQLVHVDVLEQVCVGSEDSLYRRERLLGYFVWETQG